MNENFEIGESSKNVGKNNVEDIGKLDNISNLVSKDNQNVGKFKLMKTIEKICMQSKF
jgi:hypothetical protein